MFVFEKLFFEAFTAEENGIVQVASKENKGENSNKRKVAAKETPEKTPDKRRRSIRRR